MRKRRTEILAPFRAQERFECMRQVFSLILHALGVDKSIADTYYTLSTPLSLLLLLILLFTSSCGMAMLYVFWYSFGSSVVRSLIVILFRLLDFVVNLTVCRFAI
uniref:Uncharacterized protein n=1 Tax=Anopheles maculatus TaxID=74869 RepID=A0A182TCH3_9DIPT